MNRRFCHCAKPIKSILTLGAAISPPSLTMHADLLKKHFNSITCENQMKYEPMHPAEDKWILNLPIKLSPLQRKRDAYAHACAGLAQSDTEMVL